MNLHVIEPSTKRNTMVRACAYARVSTIQEEQENSLNNQVTHYENMIRSNPSYVFVRVYHDFGISGYK